MLRVNAIICLQPGMYVTLHIANVPSVVVGKFVVYFSRRMVVSVTDDVDSMWSWPATVIKIACSHNYTMKLAQIMFAEIMIFMAMNNRGDM